MNREIKFRAWHKYLKKMYNVCILNMENKFVGLEGFERDCKEALGGISYGCDLEFVELMQYIGLKDKKKTEKFPEGQEIYEGDILNQWIEGIKQDELFIVKNLYNLHIEMNRDDNYYKVQEVEIIGNVFEHPELLGGE